MKLNPPSKLNFGSIVAGGLVITAVVVVVAGFSLKSLGGRLLLNNEIIAKKSEAQKQITANLAALDSLKREYEDLGPRRTLIADALPTTPNFPAIVSMTESLSKDSGVKLTNIAPGTDIGAGPVAGTVSTGPIAYEYTATIRGGYDSFKEFLRNVELSVRPLAIRLMTITGESNSLNVELTIKTYYQKDFDLNLQRVPARPQTGDTASTNTTIINPSSANSLNPAAGAGATP